MSQDMKARAKKLRHVLTHEIPGKGRAKLLEIIDDSFRAEKYKGKKSSKKWKSRKNDPEASKSRTKRRALLVKDGDMRQEFEDFQKGAKFGVENPVPYTNVHNEGLKSGRGKGFKMAKRQMAPIEGEEVPVLSEYIEEQLDRAMDDIFN